MLQVLPMYWQYLGAVLARALQPTVRITDGLQILAASFVALIVRISGVKMTDDLATNILAYVGMATSAFIVIRLFWAPYALWKDDRSEISGLKLELTKPEQMIMERLARHRAKARAKLAAELEDLQTYAFAKEWSDFAINGTSERMTTIRRLQAQAGLSESFASGVAWLLTYVRAEAEAPNSASNDERKSVRTLKALQRHLVGDLTVEDLASQLTRDTRPFRKNDDAPAVGAGASDQAI